jgi:4-hydroxy-3-methylbut-2-enyl diphosphate reductase IspH
MDADARSAVRTLDSLACSGRIGVAGRFMPDSGISDRLRQMGVIEGVEEEEFAHFQRMVIPCCGIGAALRRRLEDGLREFIDLTAPSVRRAQVALGMLRVEGAQPLVIGRHGDPETMALAGIPGGAQVIEETTDIARLEFSPAFGVVCQTTLSRQRVSWLVQQLRLRYRDSRVTFLDTTAPGMAARLKALEELLEWCDGVVVVGDGGEASCTALAEAALRRDKPTCIAATPGSLQRTELSTCRKIALTAGAFATDHAVRTIATTLMER